MERYLMEFVHQFAFSEDACACLKQAYAQISENEERIKRLGRFICMYEENSKCHYEKLMEEMAEIAEDAGVHVSTGNLLLYICLSKSLKNYYDEAGYEERMWRDSMMDLRWKSGLYHKRFGVWGIPMDSWFPNMFCMQQKQLFGFGKLQFELRPFQRNYQKDTLILKPEDMVINTHIPYTGERLNQVEMREAYNRAAIFFRSRFGIERPIFVCRSWLLFPRNREILSPSSNIFAFMSDFDVIEQGEYANYEEIWRLFGVDYDGDVEKLPQDTSLRRVYAEWIRRGEKTGWGYGVYVYEQKM